MTWGGNRPRGQRQVYLELLEECHPQQVNVPFLPGVPISLGGGSGGLDMEPSSCPHRLLYMHTRTRISSLSVVGW